MARKSSAAIDALPKELNFYYLDADKDKVLLIDDEDLLIALESNYNRLHITIEPSPSLKLPDGPLANRNK